MSPPFFKILFLTSFVTGLGVAPLAGQGIIPFAAGGVALGTGDLADETDPGWVVLAGVDVPLDAVVVEGLSLRSAVSLARIPFMGDFGEGTRVTGFTWELRYHLLPLDRTLRPFVEGGGGGHVHRYDPGELDAVESGDVRAAAVAGAGVQAALGSIELLLGARFATGTDAGHLTVYGGLALPLR